MVLADGANAGCFRSLVANRLRETHFLPRFQVVELLTFDAIAMKIDLPSIVGSNEPVVAFRMKRSNRSVGRGLVRLDVPLAPANEILEFAAGRIEGIVQRHFYVLVTASGRRIAAHDDIVRAGNGQMQPDAVGVALMTAMLRLADHDAGRGDSVVKLLKLADPELTNEPIAYLSPEIRKSAFARLQAIRHIWAAQFEVVGRKTLI